MSFKYFPICWLNTKVNIPIEISTKKEAKPELVISFIFFKTSTGFVNFKLLDFFKKCVSIIKTDTIAPMLVAAPAPTAPKSKKNIKNQSPNILNTPPITTDIVAKSGSESFRKKMKVFV